MEQDGVKVLIDTKSAIYLMGAELDYVEGLMGAGFKVNNPNAKSTCGCGESFQV
jgi:iron-sulfur cluster assembly accessory protein